VDWQYCGVVRDLLGSMEHYNVEQGAIGLHGIGELSGKK